MKLASLLVVAGLALALAGCGQDPKVAACAEKLSAIRGHEKLSNCKKDYKGFIPAYSRPASDGESTVFGFTMACESEDGTVKSQIPCGGYELPNGYIKWN